MNKLKNKLLIKGLAYDVVGMTTLVIPVVGPFLDILWAPYAAKTLQKNVPRKKGKLASGILFIEEILPGTDIIPTFTLMWLYTYVWNKEKPGELRPIKVRS